MYPQFKEADSPNEDDLKKDEDDLDKENSQDEDDSKEDPSSSSDDDSQAVTNAIAIATEHRKEMRRMHRLSSSPRKNQAEKINKKPKHWDVLDWKNLPPHPECLLDRERDSASHLLSKGENCSNMTRATNGRKNHPYHYRQSVHKKGTNLNTLVDMMICSFFVE